MDITLHISDDQLDRLAEVLANRLTEKMSHLPKPTGRSRPTVSAPPPPATEPPATEPPPAPAKPITVEDIRAVINRINAIKHRARIIEIMQKYGVKNVSGVKTDDLPRMHADLLALEQELGRAQ